ncbi:GspH/FimT family pseudopilin [Marinobacter nauticus]|uniref:GspH/FimT family pseudopilin n=1 Tax=Marinobacter nauticus TaxID=2743 RepID=UPI001CFCF5EA|nr:GspH/FimT family pseudopilin [Marinobacter nauticus]
MTSGGFFLCLYSVEMKNCSGSWLMRSTRAQRGFTLIELLVVIVLVGITAAIAVPNFGRLIDSSQHSAAANDMSGLLNFARSEAIRRGSGVAVYARDTSNANAGYAVCIQTALAACKAGTAGPDQLLRTTNSLPGTVTVSQMTPTSAADLIFNGRGMASQQFDYRVCGQSGSEAVDIEVNVGGQVRVDSNTGTNCP